MKTKIFLRDIPFNIDGDFFIELGQHLKSIENEYEDFACYFYGEDSVGVFGIRDETEQEAEQRIQLEKEIAENIEAHRERLKKMEESMRVKWKK